MQRQNRILNVILAEGLNLGLSKIAEASNTNDFFQLSRLSRWHIESEAIDRALGKVIEAQGRTARGRPMGPGPYRQAVLPCRASRQSDEPARRHREREDRASYGSQMAP